MADPRIANNLGPVLLGGLIALGTFKNDFARVRIPMKRMFDVMHSGLVCAGNWQYLIENFGDRDIIDWIPLAVAVSTFVGGSRLSGRQPDRRNFASLQSLTPRSFTIPVSPNTELTVSPRFFTHRVLVLSKNNWFISGPMWQQQYRLVSWCLAISRVHLRSFDAFVTGYSVSPDTVHMPGVTRLIPLVSVTGQWVFTFGLSSAATLDILITVSLCWYLAQNRTGISSMDQVVDAIMIYTINNGILTCVCTVISLICWVVMPHNLIFLGIHFALSKLYANSFMATSLQD
ncbi:hypothetical protein GLOTRDRAFT_89602 [Gloeophyllum trabeum ATCC 11539]|uniref:DUF6534 domain-containing protein n=1 Tax=Gloeophyllum trabeum (strain ATCC 11539 / FP-39264 / Madison 617) TaxID=670483 RepID=S7QPJ0_GLOTA|nr:uncharacterized protein GLOTRDRAFT_89602 [Gloeophyllum trabeum ATCC 11539]EPQ61448.1 hypothetical protein GLOTRDRAFT_89602 [Gloeophyllum trabeum ATCC 11539]